MTFGLSRAARHAAGILAACLTAGLIGLAAQAPGAGGQGGAGGGPGGRGGGGVAPRGGQGGGARGQNPPRDSQPAAAPTGTGAIAGTVTQAGGVSPVRRAQVTLNGGGGRGARSATTNDQGHFSFAALPAGRFTLNVSKPGYVNLAYGAKAPGRPGTPIQLADGQSLSDLKISLPKGSVITGVVIDEFGDPSPNTPVRAFRFTSQNGQRTLQSSGQAQTDDRGIYRIFQLMPGEYLVSAVPRNTRLNDVQQQIQAQLEPLLQQVQAGGGMGALMQAGGNLMASGRGQQLLDQVQQLQQQLAQQPEQAVGYAPVYFPGTVSPGQASKVTLGIGEERAAVDFQLQLVPTAKVTGRVASPDGVIPQGTQVTLQLAGQQDVPNVPGIGTAMTRIEQDGTFSFQAVAPGQYTALVRASIRQVDPNAPQDANAAARGRGAFASGRGGPGGPIVQMLWASAEVGVEGRDVTNVALNLQPGMTISGRVTFNGTAAQPPADLTTVRVNLRPIDNQPGFAAPGAQLDAVGNFSINGVPPGRYAVGGNVNSAGRGTPTPTPTATATTASWSLKSAVVNGIDALDFPFEIKPNDSPSGMLVTFTDRTQALSGTLQDATGRPTSDYTIVLFPADTRYWTPQSRRIQSTRPGTDGTFTFSGFPAGQYRLTAVTDAEPGEWYDPAFLSQIVSASMSITIAEGEKHTQDLRLAGQ